LALTLADFDFEKGTVSISKSYQRMDKRDVITEPKTPKSNRVIKMPNFLTEEIQEYVKQLYGVGKHERLFPISKNYLHREMTRGADEAGVKRIRLKRMICDLVAIVDTLTSTTHKINRTILCLCHITSI